MNASEEGANLRHGEDPLNRIWAIVVASLALALAVPALALGAGNISAGGYGGTQGKVLGKIVKTTPVKAQAVRATKGTSATPKLAGAVKGGTLPFTGLDLTLLAVGGAVLVATGIGLRRSTSVNK